MAPAEGSTISVAITVLRVDRATGGRLLALADVELVVDGLVLALHGVRVIRTGPRSTGVEPPTYRRGDGVSAPAMTLPPELTAAIADAVLDEFEAVGRLVPHKPGSGARL